MALDEAPDDTENDQVSPPEETGLKPTDADKIIEEGSITLTFEQIARTNRSDFQDFFHRLKVLVDEKVRQERIAELKGQVSNPAEDSFVSSDGKETLLSMEEVNAIVLELHELKEDVVDIMAQIVSKFVAIAREKLREGMLIRFNSEGSMRHVYIADAPQITDDGIITCQVVEGQPDESGEGFRGDLREEGRKPLKLDLTETPVAIVADHRLE